MPDRKNQHFVPRVLLRPFTDDAEGTSINLYNIDSDRLIRGAPVKGQCARNYWYGKDGQLEGLLSGLESLFGCSRTSIVDGSNSDIDRTRMRLFMHIQHWRTAKAAANFQHSVEQLNKNSWAPTVRDEVPNDKKAIITSMRFGFSATDMIEDLKIRVVENRTRRDFIICDDPAVMLNRFAVEVLDGSAFGVASSGLILLMPISPRLSVLCYDGLVYALDLTNSRAVLGSEATADAYNDIQLIAAHKNIYFQKWEDREYVRERFAAVKHKRRPASVVDVYVPDGESDRFEHYRPGTVDEARAAKRSISAVRFNHPEPDRWIPGLRYRAKPTTFSNGTGIGHVRRPQWLQRGGGESRARSRP